MSVTITINAENANHAQAILRQLLNGDGSESPAITSAEFNGAKAEEPQVKTRKPRQAKAAPEATTEAANENEASAAPAAMAPVAENLAAMRTQVGELIKELYNLKGDSFLPTIKGVLSKYGAVKQSEIKDEDVEAVYGKFKELQAKEKELEALA